MPSFPLARSLAHSLIYTSYYSAYIIRSRAARFVCGSRTAEFINASSYPTKLNLDRDKMLLLLLPQQRFALAVQIASHCASTFFFFSLSLLPGIWFGSGAIGGEKMVRIHFCTTYTIHTRLGHPIYTQLHNTISENDVRSFSVLDSIINISGGLPLECFLLISTSIRRLVVRLSKQNNVYYTARMLCHRAFSTLGACSSLT